MRIVTVLFSALALAPSVAFTEGTPPSSTDRFFGAQGTPVQYVAGKEFRLPFSASPRLPSTLGVLYASLDGGMTWEIADKALPGEDDFKIRVVNDGRYEFAVQTADADHLGELHAPTETELTIVVDTRKPVLTGNATVTLAGKVHLRWQARDSNIAAKTAAARTRAVDEHNWNPWKPPLGFTQPADTVVEGHFVLDIPEGESLIEVMIADVCGNVSVERLKVHRRKVTSEPTLRKGRGDLHAAIPEPVATADHARPGGFDPDAQLTPAAAVELLSDKESSPVLSTAESINILSDESREMPPLFPPRIPSSVKSSDDMTTKEGLRVPPASQAPLFSPDQPTPPAAPTEDSNPLHPLTQGVGLQSALSDLDIEVMLRAGRNSKALDRTAEAERYFRTILEARPDFTAARRELAGLLLRQGNAESLFHYRRLQESGVWDSDTQKDYARALAANANVTEAIQVLRTLMQQRPSDIGTVTEYVRLCIAQGAVSDAQDAIDAATEGVPAMAPDDVADLAELELAVSRPAKALALAERYNRSGTNRGRMCSLLLRSLSLTGQHSKCLSEARRNVDLYSKSDGNWHSVAEELIASGSHDAADAIIDGMSRLDGANVAVDILKADSLLQRGFPGMAAEQVRVHALSGEPEAVVLLADAYRNLGQYSSALRLLSDSDLATNKRARSIRADVYHQTGQYALAESTYAGIDDPAYGLLPLSRLYAQIRRYSDSATIASIVASSEPHNLNARILYFQAVSSRDGVDSAINECNQAIAQTDGEAAERVLRLVLGMLLVRNSEPFSAINEFEKATQLSNVPIANPDILYAYYDALRSTGQPQDAAVVMEASTLTPRKAVAAADVAIAHKNITLASQIISQATAMYTGNGLIQFAQARVLNESNNNVLASDVYSQLLGTFPNSEQAELSIAHLLWKQKEYAQADNMFGNILGRMPQHRIAFRDRARMAYQWRGRKEALNIYEEALAAAPTPVQFALLSVPGVQSAGFTGDTHAWQNAALELERESVELADWRPENAAVKVEEIFEITNQSDRFLVELLARQYASLQRFEDASRVLTDYAHEYPGELGITHYVNRMNAKLVPNVQGDFEYFAQSGRNGLSEVTRYDIGGSVRVPYGNGSQYIGGGYIHRIVKPTSSAAASAYGHIVELDARLKAFDRAYWTSTVGATQFSRGYSTRPELVSQLEYRVLDGFTWYLNGSLQNLIENSETVEQNIYKWEIGPGFSWSLHPDVTVDGHYAFAELSDANGYHSGMLGCRVAVAPSPFELTIRGDIQYDAYREGTFRPMTGTLTGTIHPYFSPSDFLRGSLVAEYTRTVIDEQAGIGDSFWSLNAGGQFDSFDLFYLIFGGALHWEVNPKLNIDVRSSFLFSGEYDSHSVIASMTYLPWRNGL